MEKKTLEAPGSLLFFGVYVEAMGRLDNNPKQKRYNLLKDGVAVSTWFNLRNFMDLNRGLDYHYFV